MRNKTLRTEIRKNNLGESSTLPETSILASGDIFNIEKKGGCTKGKGGDEGDECECEGEYEEIEEIKALKGALNAIEKERKEIESLKERIKSPDFNYDVQGIEKNNLS